MMDDLSSKLSSILSDPEAMKEIAALASTLGVDAQGVHKEPEPKPPAPATPDGASALSMMSSLMPLLGTLKADDDTTRLLDAIRPFLSEERRHKLDKAKRLIQMMRLLPLLKGLDIFE